MLNGNSLLTPLQSAFLDVFAEQAGQDRFYLTGGTALAEFYFGHRLTSHLVFPTSEADLLLPFSYQVEAACSTAGIQVDALQPFASFTDLTLSRGDERLEVTLALDTTVQLQLPVQSEYGVWVSAHRDLYAERLLAYYRGPELQDAVDLYFILQERVLDTLCVWATQKDPGFDLYWLAVALSRAADFPGVVDRWPVRMIAAFDPAGLKQSLVELAYMLMFQITGPADVFPHP
jgi:hypothetical protein